MQPLRAAWKQQVPCLMLDKQAFNQYIDEQVCSFEMMMNPAAKGNRSMVRGRVKWFNDTKGYGYIIR
ncbi:MAG: cold shock domain-containing protein, partial [candidate division KSB1 bacterium]|nr:cold shock domain-containing protein [candidate division KSB1 bacterium]